MIAHIEITYGHIRAEPEAEIHSMWMSPVCNILPGHASCCGPVRSWDRDCVHLELRTISLWRQ